MKKYAAATAAVFATSVAAQAGGLDRDPLTTSMLFEEGTYVELSYSNVSPEVSGVGVNSLFAGRNSGNISDSYSVARLSFRQDITEALSFALISSEPYGSNVNYGPSTYPFANSTAALSTNMLTAALRYEFDNGFSAYAGLNALAVDTGVYVSTPTFAYRLTGDSDYELGHMVGVAYERPDIALRVALTYFSEIEVGMSGAEGVAAAGTASGAVATSSSAFNVTMPESLLLEMQSGVSENTLVFGSVRWTGWDGFQIRPNRYPAGALVNYTDDVYTYTLGVGHRLNENWSVSASVDYEAATGGFKGNLGPTDGRRSFALGAEYSRDNYSVTAGIRRIEIGDAQTILSTTGPMTSSFSGNSATAVGIRFGYQF